MVLRVIIDILIGLGFIFALAGVIGIIKMPDTYCRMQASTCVSTLGMLGVMTGCFLYAMLVLHNHSAAVKIAVIAVMVIITNPIGSHAIAKGTYKSGVRPEKKMETDDYGRDFDE